MLLSRFDVFVNGWKAYVALHIEGRCSASFTIVDSNPGKHDAVVYMNSRDASLSLLLNVLSLLASFRPSFVAYWQLRLRRSKRRVFLCASWRTDAVARLLHCQQLSLHHPRANALALVRTRSRALPPLVLLMLLTSLMLASLMLMMSLMLLRLPVSLVPLRMLMLTIISTTMSTIARRTGLHIGLSQASTRSAAL